MKVHNINLSTKSIINIAYWVGLLCLGIGVNEFFIVFGIGALLYSLILSLVYALDI